MLALTLADRLHQPGEVVIVCGDGLEGGDVRRGGPFGGVRDLEVVDRVAFFGGETVVGRVHADGVGDGDGGHGEDVGLDGVPDVGEVEDFAVEYLCVCLVSFRY